MSSQSEVNLLMLQINFFHSLSIFYLNKLHINIFIHGSAHDCFSSSWVSESDESKHAEESLKVNDSINICVCV